MFKKIIFSISLVALLVTSLLLSFPLSVSADNANIAKGCNYITFDLINNERVFVDQVFSLYTGKLTDGYGGLIAPGKDGFNPAGWFAFSRSYLAGYNNESGLGRVVIDLGSVQDVGLVRVWTTTVSNFNPQYISVYYSEDDQYNMTSLGVCTMPDEDVGWAVLNGDSTVKARYLRLEVKIKYDNAIIGEIEVFGNVDAEAPSEEVLPPLSSTAEIYWVGTNEKLFSMKEALLGGPVIGKYGLTTGGYVEGYYGYGSKPMTDEAGVELPYYFQCAINQLNDLFVEQGVQRSEKTFLCRYNYGKINLTQYNHITFTIYPMISQSASLSVAQRIAITIDGEPYYGGDIAITRGKPQTYYSFDGFENTVYPYKCEVYLEPNNDFNEVTFGVQFLADLNDFRDADDTTNFGKGYYAMGVTELTAVAKTQEEFIGGIASGIADINQGLGSIENVLEDTKEVVTIISDSAQEIVDALNTQVPPELKEKVMEQVEALNQADVAQQVVDTAINSVLKDFENNIDFEIFENKDTYLDKYVDPLYANDGFLNFWNGLWSQPFIVAMCLTVMSFCVIGFVLYGVH